MSRDALDLFGLVAHGARDGAEWPLIQDAWCSLSGGAGSTRDEEMTAGQGGRIATA